MCVIFCLFNECIQYLNKLQLNPPEATLKTFSSFIGKQKNLAFNCFSLCIFNHLFLCIKDSAHVVFSDCAGSCKEQQIPNTHTLIDTRHPNGLLFLFLFDCDFQLIELISHRFTHTVLSLSLSLPGVFLLSSSSVIYQSLGCHESSLPQL